VEARDPITEPGAPSGAGASEATAAAGGKGKRPRGQDARGQCFYCGPGREPRGGKRGRAVPKNQPMRSEVLPGAGADVGASSSSPLGPLPLERRH